MAVDDLASTEIKSIDPATNTNYLGSYTHIEKVDNLQVQEVINEINGNDSTGQTNVGVPTAFGGNFQSLGVAQKATVASGDGYLDADFTPRPEVSGATGYIDGAPGRFVSEPKVRNLYSTTAIIVTAKHGQSPTDHTKLVKNGDTLTKLLEASTTSTRTATSARTTQPLAI
jgi:hypothetical protein